MVFMKRKLLILNVAAALSAASLYAAPPKYQYGQENNIAIRELQASVDEMRHEIKNHETEIRTYEEKFANQELIIESLREQNANISKSNQDLTKSNLANIEMKIGSLDTASKGLISDLRQIKTHANESSSAIGSCQQKILAIEKIVEVQNQNLENLSAAIKSLMSVLEVKHELTGSFDPSSNLYLVLAGDSLEKIARLHKTSIKALKELNDLNSDRIKVGQRIKIP